MMIFKVDENVCIGCGLCQNICPKCFVLKNGVAKVVEAKIDDDCCDFHEVVDSCPCQAIKIKNKN